MAQGMGVRARVANALRFILRPTPHGPPLAWGRGLAAALATVFALDLGLDFVIVEATGRVDEAIGFLPAAVPLETSLAEDLFAFLLLAPAVEEALWRGWLTGRVAALRFAACGFAALGLMLAGWLAGGAAAGALTLAGLAIAFLGGLHWLATRHRDTAVPAWFTRHFRWLVWGSSLAFGLIHLGNHEPLTHPLGLLVVLPQTLGGLLLAYVRTRLGLGAAMVHHAGYNAVFLARDYGLW